VENAMTKKTVMLEIKNIFNDKALSLETVADRLKMDVERFNDYHPVPMYKDHSKLLTPDTMPDSYILLVDEKTAQEITGKFPKLEAKSWSNGPIGPC